MEEESFTRMAALGSAAVGVLSLVYSLSYLVITPAPQRGSDVGQAMRSYLAHPLGLRIASVSLMLAGLMSGAVVVALIGRLQGAKADRSLAWAGIVAVVGGLATSVHGLGDLLTMDKLAHQYATASAATKAAVVLAHGLPSGVDPKGLMTFGAGGLVTLVIGLALRPTHRRLGVLGVVLGIDMVVLFVANAVGITALVLVSGGLASVVLGPIWWLSITRLLWLEMAEAPAPAVVVPMA